MSGPFGSSQWMYSSGGFYDFPIEQSLKFNDDDTAYLGKSFATTGTDRKKITFSFWYKKTTVGTINQIYNNFNGTNEYAQIAITSDDKLEVYSRTAGGTSYNRTTSAQLRDPSAWYHIVVSIDTTQATADDRIKIYINGVLQTSFAVNNIPPQNTEMSYFISGRTTAIGRRADGGESSHNLDGYLAEYHVIDGTAYAASNFGEFKSGVWIPKQYGGTYGTNGFRLSFADSSNIGDDTSGNTNDWTANSLVATDVLLDSPTNNFCTLNPLDTYGGAWTLSEGNLKGASSAVNGCRRSTMSVSSGKYYWEVYIADDLNYHVVGVSDQTCNGWATTPVGGSATGVGWFYAGRDTNPVSTDVNANTSASYGTSFAVGDIVGVALDMDAGTIEFYKNGASQGVAYSNLSGYTLSPTMAQSSGSVMTDYYNFGQDSSFAGNKTAQGNTDDNGIGDFFYPVPSGFLALAASNLPNPTIDPAQDDSPSDYFSTVLYSGNSSTQSITGVGFQPDWVWIKSRNVGGANHVLTDAVRGVEKFLISNLTDSEYSVANTLTSFDADGFSLGNTAYDFNISGNNYVAWNWLAGNGTSSNTDGSISSTISVNQKAGFSVVSYTGTGATSSGVTIGHGLGATPAVIITKKRTGGTDYGWSTWHKDLGGNYGIWLDKTSARNPSMWGGYTNISSTVFSPPDLLYGNESGADYINYLFAEVEGFSRFGSFVGNGSNDGPMIFTGHSPAFLMVKRTDSSGDWYMFDKERATYNVVTTRLWANLSSAELSSSVVPFDFLSNGFKARNSDASFNANGGTYIYLSFASNPFKYSTAR